MPKHIAIIMDGNRRWAKLRGKSPSSGHKVGYENFKRIAKRCYGLGVKILTVYALSSENLKRSKAEVSYLMRLFEIALKKEKNFFNKNNIKLNVIGKISELPSFLKNAISKATNETMNNTGGILNLAVNYGGRQEIIEAVKKIFKEGLRQNQITEDVFEQNLYTAGSSDPDLIIRTGGELRLSGFLLWQSAYSELYFSPKLWPDFAEDDLEEAIAEFKRRQRRFGK